MKRRVWLALLGAMATVGVGACGAPAAEGQGEIKVEVEALWPLGAPGPKLVEGTEEGDAEGRRWHISEPTISAYLPAAEKATGTAVVICPGGGYRIVAMEKEGVATARWLQERGVAAFIVKYRVEPFGWPWPVADAQEAVRLVRARAERYGVDPGRVGICGFSAGGHLAATVTTHEAAELGEWASLQREETRGVSCRPDFSILIYPVITMEAGVTHRGSRERLLGKEPTEEMVAEFSNEKQVRAGMGPVFLLAASDDRVVPVANSLRFYEACVEAKVPAELHVFERGGHGFGIGEGMAAGAWPGLCERWMEGHGWLEKK